MNEFSRTLNIKNIAIFASGSGTNAENIIRYFSGSDHARVALVLSNKPDASVLHKAGKLGVPSAVFDRIALYETGEVAGMLVKHRIDLVVLAGFLWLVPKNILDKYSGRIINIHPALLPGYGGKGMYGRRVHEAVIAAGDPESGITIHYVNEKYDDGDVIFQARCPVLPSDTPENLASRIHELEYRHLPRVIDELLGKN